MGGGKPTMAAMKKGTWIFALALGALVAGRAEAEPKPYRHPATGLVLPPTLADMRQTEPHDYEPESPGLGVSVGRQAPGTTATIYLYTLGQASIPAGAAAPEVAAHFRQVLEDIAAHGQAQGYERFRKTAEGEIGFGPPGAEFRARTADMQYALAGEERLTKVDLLGWRNHFLKVRYTYAAGVREAAERRHVELLDILADRMKAADGEDSGAASGGE